MAGISLVQSVPKNTRVTRRPQHTFQVRHVPFAIQPFLIAPVLPGETMENMLLQSRVVSDPIKNPLTGWWLEYYFFYVKHRDLDEREDLTAMALDMNHDLSGLYEAASEPYYHFGGTINWSKLCLKRVVDEYFRDEGEAWDGFTIGGMPSASINANGWWDTMMPLADWGEDDGVDVDLDADGTITTGEIDQARRMWEFMSANKLTKMDYEDFLATYGVRPAKEELHKPELIRYVRDWTYPVNTVDPASGSPSSACSWVVSERLDKDRFFREPGFIFGVTCCRPKTYYRNQIGSGVWYLKSLQTWLPAVMEDDPMTSVIQVGGSAVSPVDIANADYMLDVRDLFIYGDQFINFDPAATDANMVPLPSATTLHRYITAIADIDEFFVTAGTNRIRHDGVVTLSIKGRQRDRTPTELSKT